MQRARTERGDSMKNQRIMERLEQLGVGWEDAHVVSEDLARTIRSMEAEDAIRLMMGIALDRSEAMQEGLAMAVLHMTPAQRDTPFDLVDDGMASKMAFLLDRLDDEGGDAFFMMGAIANALYNYAASHPEHTHRVVKYFNRRAQNSGLYGFERTLIKDLTGIAI